MVLTGGSGGGGAGDLMLIMELERLIKDLTVVKVEVPDKLKAVVVVVLEVLEAV
jgi:hypothetical protein